MLKKICGLFLGLVVCIGSACVTPTHASSASSVIITHIQAGGVGAAREEFVVLYNTTADVIDISGWCLANKYEVTFFCFNSENTGYSLSGYSHAVIASEDIFETAPGLFEIPPYTYTVTNQSSGSIVGSSETLTIVDANKTSIDVKSWTSSLASGKMWARQVLLEEPRMYAILGGEADWTVETSGGIPLNEVVEYEKILPEDPGIDDSILSPVISELLPNPEGTDTGSEFIELYNPNQDHAVELANYTFRVGKSLEKTYTFPEDTALAPQGYRAFTNEEISFTLLNSTSSVQLYYNEVSVGEVVLYNEPASGMAWAYIGDSWVYTSTPTPNKQNLYTVLQQESDSSLLKPCAANQYRSPETNRCRSIETSQTTLTPCKENQYRSSETNRCRNIVQDDGPAPCKEGQERNPETNRCRNIVAMTQVGQGVKGAETVSEGVNWYLWLGIAGVVVAVLSYALWEWREETRAVIRRIRVTFTRTKT